MSNAQHRGSMVHNTDFISLEVKRGFVNSFHFHLQVERVNKCEIKILAELISLNLSLINYRVCNNSLEKSTPQTWKAWRAVRYMAKQQGFMKRPRFPPKIKPSPGTVRRNGHRFALRLPLPAHFLQCHLLDRRKTCQQSVRGLKIIDMENKYQQELHCNCTASAWGWRGALHRGLLTTA